MNIANGVRTAFDLLYRVLLFAYPADFRHQFGAEMLQVARDQQRKYSGTPKLAMARLLLVVDVLKQGSTERWFTLRQEGRVPSLCSGALALVISASLLVVTRTGPPQPGRLQAVSPVVGALGPLGPMVAGLADPTMAFLLLTAGLYGIIFEVSSPGAILPGVLGALSTAAGSLSLATLPINYLGLAMLLASFGLSLLGVKLPAHGLLSGAGLVLLVGGGLVLFNFGSSGLSISAPVVLATAIVSSLFFGVIARFGKAARELPPVMGPGELIGKLAEVRTPIDTRGKVFVRGEWWNAACDEPVSRGSHVQVVSVEGLTLRVRPMVAA